MNASEVRDVLRSLGVRADKRFGQHFLVDERVAHRQVEFAAIRRDERVLEIGPGLGVLTRILSERSRNVIAIEKDRRFCRFLEREIPDARIIEGDALKVDLPQFDVVISNLPYQISSPITFRLLENKFDRAVLMFQKEFADRMVAKRGGAGYSRLSVHVYYRALAEVIERVPRSAFYPPPEVDSSILSLRPRKPPFKVRDEGLFSNMVDRMFQHRRKTIENSLLLNWREFAASREAVKKAVESSGFGGMRPEELEPEQMGKLADELWTAQGTEPV
jgi:16S rRNA (adenine1518-N6/adenine1519-N6)-dimethyltransferase